MISEYMLLTPEQNSNFVSSEKLIKKDTHI